MERDAREIMSREIICVPPDMDVAEAFALMRQAGVRHLPIVEGYRLVGIVSDRDLLPLAQRDAEGGLNIVEALPIGEIMSREPLTRAPRTSVSELAELMVREKIDSVPIVADQELVGLVTSSDLLELLTSSGVAPNEVLPFLFTVRRTGFVAAENDS